MGSSRKSRRITLWMNEPKSCFDLLLIVNLFCQISLSPKAREPGEYCALKGSILRPSCQDVHWLALTNYGSLWPFCGRRSRCFKDQREDLALWVLHSTALVVDEANTCVRGFIGNLYLAQSPQATVSGARYWFYPLSCNVSQNRVTDTKARIR